MAEATGTIQNLSWAGIDITATTGTAGTADGARFLNVDRQLVLLFHNSSVGSLVVTVVGQGVTAMGANFANESLTIPAGKTYIFGPVAEAQPYNDGSNYVHVTFPSGSESSILYRAIKV